MILAVWAPFVVPFLAAPAARRLADALAPRAASWVLATTAVLLAGASAGSLGLLAGAGLLPFLLVAALGHLSAPWFAEPSPAAVLAAALAGGALLATGELGRRTAHHQYTDLRRARTALGHRPQPGRGRGHRHEDHPLAVLDDDRADAYALPGRPGRIVVTTGMLRALPAPERAALLAHERAHLTCRHHLFLAAAEYAAVLHPALRALRAPLGFHLERWADEAAARSVRERTGADRAGGRA
ncbi:M56 family metallopeptidase, partial [Kitasatospora nipponensis]|uniref:M56 family metallopeptidase n=1 Tax=Kitasatospora nipponensis TaxID=258049 RepID=UPI0031DFE70D